MEVVKRIFHPSSMKHSYLRLKKLYLVSLLYTEEAYEICLTIYSFSAINQSIKLFLINTIFSILNIIVLYYFLDLRKLEALKVP